MCKKERFSNLSNDGFALGSLFNPNVGRFIVVSLTLAQLSCVEQLVVDQPMLTNDYHNSRVVVMLLCTSRVPNLWILNVCVYKYIQ